MSQLAMCQAERDRFRDALDDSEAQVTRLEGKNAALEVALRGLDAFVTELAESGDSGDWEPADFPAVARARTALSSERQGCTCTAPPMQPCGPKCKYPYADQAGEGQGWLSPEVAERAAGLLREAKRIIRHTPPGSGVPREEEEAWFKETLAVLAALEGE